MSSRLSFAINHGKTSGHNFLWEMSSLLSSPLLCFLVSFFFVVGGGVGFWLFGQYCGPYFL